MTSQIIKKNLLRASLSFLLILGIGVTPTQASVSGAIAPTTTHPAGEEFVLPTASFSVSARKREDGKIQADIAPAQLVQQGRKLYEAEQFSQAVLVWQQAAKAYQDRSDRLSQAMVLSNLSLTYQQLGQWQQAEGAIASSLELLEYSQARVREEERKRVREGEDRSKITPLFPLGQTPRPEWLQNHATSSTWGDSKTRVAPKSKIQNLTILAQALNTQGSLQLALGQAEKALDTWEKAAATYDRAGSRSGTIQSQINSAQALQALGLYRRALTTLSQVKQTFQKQPASRLKASLLRNLGNTQRVVGDLDESRQTLQESLAIAQQMRSPTDIGAALFSLGNTARTSFGGATLTQADSTAALTFYQQAATISPSAIAKLQALLNQLSLSIETEQLDRAKALIPEIQSQLPNLPPSSKTVYAQIDFAHSLMDLGARSEGGVKQRDIAQILATSVQQARGLGDKRAEAYALGNLGRLYEQSGQVSNAKELTTQALILAQSVNAPDIAYRWQWQLGRLLKVEGNTPAAIASYNDAVNTLRTLRRDLVAINPEIQFNFRDEVEPVYRQLVDLLLRHQGETGRVPSQQNLALARQTIESLQLAELDNFFREACLEARPVLIDKVVDRDSPNAAVIYPIILRDRLEVILKLPNQPLRNFTIIVPQSQVEQTLAQLRQNLTEPDKIKSVRSLSQEVYSWLIQPAQTELAKSRVKTLVFVADGALRNIPMSALYDGKQYLVEKYAIALNPGLQLVNPQPLPPRQLKALTAGLSIAPANYPYPPLPAVRSEFNLIEQAGVSISELLDREFTSKSLETKIDSSTFNVVHLATHGQFSSSAQNTFILAADGPINVKDFDNLLRTRNQRSPEVIDLLVLSACETATGDKRAALGLAGVAVRAGAQSTLASLWQIDDEATALFIGKFYQQLATAKVNRAEALRQAQLSLMKNYPNYSRPGYWAPYVLVGNWL